MKMGEVADLVDEHRAAVAARFLVGAEHEVVEDELTPPVEKVDEPRLSLWAVEHVVPLDPDPRQAAALCGKRISRPGRCLFLRTQLLKSRFPFFLRDDWRKIHGDLLSQEVRKPW
jgi:hypothetical protein